MKTKLLLHVVLLFLSSQLFANSAVVFMYHRFGEDTLPSTNITLEQFRYQLDYLEKHEYNVWHISRILNHLQTKKTIPPKTVALTIDDAYMSAYTNAYPMLKAKNFPFTVVVSTNPVDNGSKNYMTWDMMREMKQNGAEFANHSISHEYLLQEKDETDMEWRKRFIKEVQIAQRRIKEELGEEANKKPRLFSYPFGEYDLKTIELLQSLGYFGMTQTSGAIGRGSDFMTLSRFPMAEIFATPEGFKTKLNTLPMPIESASPREPRLKYENPPQLRVKLKSELKNLNCFLSSGEPIDIKWLSEKEFEVKSDRLIKAPREKYTCTAPAENGKWYWYSHLWIAK